MAGVGRETKPQKHPLVYIVFNKIQRKSTKVVYLIKKKINNIEHITTTIIK